MLRFVVLLVAAMWAGPPQAQMQRPMADLPLVPASSLDAETYIILSVPLDSDALLDATAEEMASAYEATVAAIWPLATVDVACYVFALAESTDATRVIGALEQDPRVITVSQVQGFDLLTTAYADDLVGAQHALKELSAVEAHALSTGSNVALAVIDSGVATEHADLVDQNVHYHDFVERLGAPMVAEPHGTAIAALIAADAANAEGMVGVAPGVELFALRACWLTQGDAETCNTFSLARALNFAISREVDIINLSLGGPPDPLLDLIVRRALARGTIVVAAHGPEAEPLFPARVPGVISAHAAHRPVVGGVAAPGLEVISAKPSGSYDFFTGDSVATAHVSGVIALLKSYRPDAIDRVLAAFPVNASTSVNACDVLRAADPVAACASPDE